MFEEYFLEYYENELLDVMKSKEVEKHYGIEIRYNHYWLIIIHPCFYFCYKNTKW